MTEEPFPGLPVILDVCPAGTGAGAATAGASMLLRGGDGIRFGHPCIRVETHQRAHERI